MTYIHDTVEIIRNGAIDVGKHAKVGNDVESSGKFIKFMTLRRRLSGEFGEVSVEFRSKLRGEIESRTN
jgi:hypothetical protein